MTRNTYLFGTLAAALAGSVAVPASAEDVAKSTEVTTEGQINGEPAADEDERDSDPMAWIGVGLKLGMGGNGEGEFEAGGVRTTIKSRAGFQVAVPINMGGSGFGWLIEPYLNMASVDGADPASAGATKSYGVTTFGFYTGPSINIHVMDPLYIGVGAGLKLGYSSSDAFDMGLDAFARVPITGTYYILDDVAGVLELGLGYGATGFAALPTLGAAGQEIEGDLQFGTALTYDITAGVRWP